MDNKKEYIYYFPESDQLIALRVPPPSLDLPLKLSIDNIDLEYMGHCFYIGEL